MSGGIPLALTNSAAAFACLIIPPERSATTRTLIGAVLIDRAAVWRASATISFNRYLWGCAV
jgi:hypothetical protein